MHISCSVSRYYNRMQ